MTTEITIHYRPDGTTEFITVQLPDKAGPDAITRIAKALTNVTRDPKPVTCGHEWSVTRNALGLVTYPVTLECARPAGHDGVHRADNGDEQWPAGKPRPCGAEWVHLDGRGTLYCTRDAGHQFDHISYDVYSGAAKVWSGDAGKPAICGTVDPRDLTARCQLRAGHLADHEDTFSGRKWDNKIDISWIKTSSPKDRNRCRS